MEGEEDEDMNQGGMGRRKEKKGRIEETEREEGYVGRN